MPPESGVTKGLTDKKQVWLGAFVVGAAVACFLLTYWNHFAGIRSGSICSGLFFVKGLLPYRDYFLWITCLSMIKSGAIVWLFGQDYIVLRASGVLLRVVLALCVYFWTARMFRPSHACLAAILCTLVGCGDVTDPMDSVNHDGILLSVAAGLAASFALKAVPDKRTTVWSGLATGSLASMALLTKQNLGVGVTLFLPAIATLSLLRLNGRRQALLFNLVFAAGWIAVALAMLLWLNSYGAVNKFFVQAFINGPQGKASSPLGLIEHIVKFAIGANLVLAESLIISFLTWRQVKQSVLADQPVAQKSLSFLSVALVVFGGIGLGLIVGYSRFPESLSFVVAKIMQMMLIYFLQFSLLAVCILIGLAMIKGLISERSIQAFFFAAFSFTLAFMGSLSFPIYEPMAIPGLALLVAASLDAAGRVRTRILATFSVLIVAVITAGKLSYPFGFQEMIEPPVRTAQSVSKLPRMKGFVLPEKTVNFIDKTVDIIESHCGPDDTIFTFPEMSIFYLLTERRWPTFSHSHNIDLITDDLGRSEAQLLLKNRPAVLIFYDVPLAALETQWRSGQHSGIRHIQEACLKLASEYRLVETIDFSDQKIKILVRPDQVPPVSPGSQDPLKR